MARLVGDFLRGFVQPLVEGGEVHVGKPISDSELVALQQGLPHATVELVAVDDARTRAISDLVVRPPSFVLDEDELALAAALHNLLFLEHPDAEAWSVPSSRLARVRDTARRFVDRPPARDRYHLLARHALLHNLFDLTRVDITLSWWTGSAKFFGQQPPRRLTRWRGVRRVSEDRATARYTDLLGDPDVESVIAALLRLTPLTDLLSDPRGGPSVEWEDAVVALRDAELARAVAYRALPLDADPDRAVAAPARFALSFERMVERRPDPADARCVAAFLVHLNALIAVAEARDPDPNAPSALLTAVLAPERAARRPRGLTTFFAMPAALQRVAPGLATPPGVAEDARVQARWQRHRAQVADAVGEAVIDTLATRLGRALGAPAA